MNKTNVDLVSRAKAMSRFKKERFIKSLTEDEFRDRIVRPIFLRKGFNDGRDVCGNDEKGKDVIFLNKDPLGFTDVYVVQTKKGNINLASKATQNVITAITQLKMCCDTNVIFIKDKTKKKPTKVFLCASGKINEAAKNHILSEVNDPRINFIDIEDIIPEVDTNYPELWFDSNVNTAPYLISLRNQIEKNAQLFTKSELIAANLPAVAISDEFFAPLNATRFILKNKIINGKIKQVPELESFPVVNLLSRNEPLILLVGGAGSGKSTALLRMAYILSENYESDDENTKIPIFLRALKVAQNNEQALIDDVYNAASEICSKFDVPFKTNDMQSGRVVILIDALDELGDKSLQRVVLHKIIDFHAKYIACQVIIASRETSFIDEDFNFNVFTKFSISSINFNQAQKIINRLYKPSALSKDKSGEILRKLQEVHGFELNPLIVTVFAASTDSNRGEIPANITELFKKFTEYMLGRWDEGKGMSQQYHAPLKDYILQQVAFYMHVNKKSIIPLTKFKDIISEQLTTRGYKSDIDLFTEEIVNRSSLFRQTNGNIEFRHHMLQEFYAGRAIKDHATLRSYIHDQWWQMALVFYFGENPDRLNILLDIAKELESESSPVKYHGSITIGLAAQACYLSTLEQKIPAFALAIYLLSDAFEDFNKQVVSSSISPLREFLNYYLYAKESIASRIFSEHSENILDFLKNYQSSRDDQIDLYYFWVLSGLIESGDLSAAYERVKNFKPKDKRLLLGILLNSHLSANHKILSSSEKRISADIVELLNPSVQSLRKTLLDEFKSELLEVQNKQIQAL